MPTPVLNWPPAPQGGSVGAAPGQGAVPAMGVFNIERGKVNALNVPPCSRSLQMFHTALPAMLLPSFSATAWAQFAGVITPTAVVQKLGFRAALKNGCSVIAATLPTQFPPPRACWFCG